MLTRLTGWALTISLVAFSCGALSYDNLAEATKAQDWDAVFSLFQQGMPVNSAMADGTTALAWSVHWNRLSAVEQLLQSEADPNAANDYGITPLMLACENREFKIIDLLLSAGADPNAKTWAGETVLMTCSRTGSLEGVKLLIDAGTDLNIREPERGQTALMWAAGERHSNVVELLVKAGADIKVRTRKMALPQQIYAPTYSKYVYFPKTKGDFTTLMIAAQAGDTGSIKALLAAGADVNESTLEYGSALLLAIVNGHEDAGLLLLENGADPNVTDGYGITPLHWAIHEGFEQLDAWPFSTNRFWHIKNSPRLVKALLNNGADPNARSQWEFAPYDVHRFARTRNNQMPQVRLAGATPFMLAAASGDLEIMNLLLERNADPNIESFETEKDYSSSGPGLTPLMAAAGVGREYILPLHGGRNNHLEAVKLLVKLGANVSQHGPGGRTALHGATYIGDTGIIRFLAENGANLDAKDWYGQTPISMALGDPGQFSQTPEQDNTLRNEMPVRENVVELLLELGAAPYDGPTPPHRED